MLYGLFSHLVFFSKFSNLSSLQFSSCIKQVYIGIGIRVSQLQHCWHLGQGNSLSTVTTCGPWDILGVSVASSHQMPIVPLPSVTTKNGSRYCQMSFIGQNHPGLRTTGLNNTLEFLPTL